MKISCVNFRKLIPISSTFFYDTLVKIINTDNVYTVFNSKKLTTNEKKIILYRSKRLDENQKNIIWEAYVGDNLLDYSNVPDID